MSDGIRSVVNWILLKEQSKELARLRASVVLPMPGTSSIKMWPPLNRAAKVSSITPPLPTSTVSTLSLILAATGATSLATAQAEVFCCVIPPAKWQPK